MVFIVTRFDEAYFDEDFFDGVTITGTPGSIKVEFEKIIDREGHTMIWRERDYTLDTASGSPESEGSPTDTSITAMFHPIKIEELSSGFFKIGDTRILTAKDNKVQTDDWIFDKDEDETGFTTISGTSDSQVVISGDQQHIFKVNNYITVDDDNTIGLYLVTGVSVSTNTTLTVALPANPGEGVEVYKAASWKVMSVQDWPSNADAQVRECLLRKRERRRT